ncbi:hypothetical protein IW262DRAFT_1301595 [Armillaria fumosa]|nr:hypothetical protein IW262DRAFT_1301595 [Armillaria fumosa]
MRLSSARSFCVICELYFLLAESRPFKVGALAGTEIESLSQEYSSNPSTSGQGFARPGKQTVTSGSSGSSGSSGGGQTVNSGDSAKPGGRTESEYMPETEICRRGKQTNSSGGSIKNGGGSVGSPGSGGGGQTATSGGSTTNSANKGYRAFFLYLRRRITFSYVSQNHYASGASTT